MFSKSSTGCWAILQLPMLPKQGRETFRKHYKKPFSQPGSTDCTEFPIQSPVRFCHVLFWEFPCPAWAVASCRIGPQAGELPKNNPKKHLHDGMGNSVDHPLLTVLILSSINPAIALACGLLYSLASSVRLMISGRTLAVSFASAVEYSSCTSSSDAIALEVTLEVPEGLRGPRGSRKVREGVPGGPRVAGVGSASLGGHLGPRGGRRAQFPVSTLSFFNMASVSFLSLSHKQRRQAERG